MPHANAAPETMTGTGQTIAVVIDVFDAYQRRLVALLRVRSEAAGYRLLVVCGGGLEKPVSIGPAGAPMRGPSAIHALTGRLDVAGYLVQPGAVGHDVDLSVVRAFARDFTHRPLVCIGIPLNGIASVAGDDEATTLALMRHMTSDPARRRFVFLRGNRGSHEACERERLFRQVMAERRLPLDESLILDTHFNPSEAGIRVEELLRAGRRFDALVAGNDIVAAVATRTLTRHGLRVPEDVIVSGFDDHEDSRLSSPPITTVRLPLEPQVDIAFSVLLGQMRAVKPAQRPPPAHVVVPCTLHVRASSLPATTPAPLVGGQPSMPPERVAATNAPAPLDGHACADRIAAAIAHGMRDTPAPEQLDMGNVMRLLGQALNGDASRWQADLNAAMRPAGGRCEAVGWWRELQGTLDRAFQAGAPGRIGSGSVANLALVQGTISNTLWAEVNQRQVEHGVLVEMLEHTHIALGGCTSTAALEQLLGEAVTGFGLRTFCMGLYTGGPAHQPGEFATLEMAIIDGADIGTARSVFCTSAIAPSELLQHPGTTALVMRPLYAGGLHYGFVLHDTDTPEALSMQTFAQSIANALQSCRQVESLEQHARDMQVANDDLARLATHDCLTGLLNRSGFLSALDCRLRDATGTGEEGALLYIDLDGFKAINDTHGHAAGDALLDTIANRITDRVRANDLVARLGGDEFTVALSEVPERATVLRITTALVQAIAEPVALADATVNVSASIGITRFPAAGLQAGGLIRQADAAMYRAKASGRNGHAWFSRSIERAEQDLRQVVQALRTGLQEGDLWLAWQPRVSLQDGRLLRYEALLRWNSQRLIGRDVGPAEFIPLAERSGLVRELDAFALERACRQQAIWEAQGLRIGVSVNLSAASLHEEGLVERIAGTLDRHGLLAEQVELELTESAAMRDVAASIACFHALRRFGLKLAIDDFGTAYSSLDYLKRLPATSLKIDRSFIKDLRSRHETNSADAAIVRAIVRLGHELGFQVVAEGVETCEQRDFLTALGCDEGQGYLFDRPMDSIRATRRLQAEHASDTARRIGSSTPQAGGPHSEPNSELDAEHATGPDGALDPPRRQRTG